MYINILLPEYFTNCGFNSCGFGSKIFPEKYIINIIPNVNVSAIFEGLNTFFKNTLKFPFLIV